MIAVLDVIKSCTCSYTRTQRFLVPRSCVYLDSLGKLGFRAKSGFKTKCRARAEFGLQNEVNLQLCPAVIQHPQNDLAPRELRPPCPHPTPLDMSELQARHCMTPEQWTWLLCSVSVVPANKLIARRTGYHPALVQFLRGNFRFEAIGIYSAFPGRLRIEIPLQLMHPLLFPFLCMGMITPVWQSFGALPEHQATWHIRVSQRTWFKALSVSSQLAAFPAFTILTAMGDFSCSDNIFLPQMHLVCVFITWKTTYRNQFWLSPWSCSNGFIVRDMKP